MAKPRKPPPTKPPKSQAPDDLELWRAVTEQVTPLPGKAVSGQTELADGDSRKQKQKSSPGAKRAIAPSPPRMPEKKYSILEAGVFAGLDKRTAQRLKRGQLAIEARLDLHRLTQDEAHRALIHFIGEAAAQGKRTALVITGKGLRASGEVGVLRTMVPRWLNQSPLRPKIVAFCEAAPKDGGSGALYLRLRKVV